jgi:hypothetical protein
VPRKTIQADVSIIHVSPIKPHYVSILSYTLSAQKILSVQLVCLRAFNGESKRKATDNLSCSVTFPLKTVEYYGDAVAEESMGIGVEQVVRQLGLVESSPSRFVVVLGGVRSYTFGYSDPDTETAGAQGGKSWYSLASDNRLWIFFLQNQQDSWDSIFFAETSLISTYPFL